MQRLVFAILILASPAISCHGRGGFFRGGPPPGRPHGFFRRPGFWPGPPPPFPPGHHPFEPNHQQMANDLPAFSNITQAPPQAPPEGFRPGPPPFAPHGPHPHFGPEWRHHGRGHGFWRHWGRGPWFARPHNHPHHWRHFGFNNSSFENSTNFNQTSDSGNFGFFGFLRKKYEWIKNHFQNTSQVNATQNSTISQSELEFHRRHGHHHHHFFNWTNQANFTFNKSFGGQKNWHRRAHFHRRSHPFFNFVFNFKNSSISSDLITRLKNLKPLFETHTSVLNMGKWHKNLKNYIQQFENVIANLTEVPKKMKKTIENEFLFENFVKQFESDFGIDPAQNKTLPETLKSILSKLKATNNTFPVLDKSKMEEINQTILDLVTNQDHLNQTVIEQEKKIEELTSKLNSVSDLFKKMSEFFPPSNSSLANQTAAKLNSSQIVTEGEIAKHIGLLEQIHKNVDKSELEQLKSNKIQIESIKSDQENRVKKLASIDNGLEEVQAARKEETESIVHYIDENTLMAGDDLKLRQVKNLAEVLANSY